MNIADFSRKYDITPNTISVQKSMGYISPSAFYTIGNTSILQVHESYFTRRWAFIKKVKYDNQALYYLLEEHFAVSHISKELVRMFGGSAGSYTEYFKKVLFSLDDRSSTKVSKLAWRVWRYFKMIERRLKRRGATIDKILDKRTEEHEKGLSC